MAIEFFRELKEAYNSGQSFVLCTVIETLGSSPGKVGQKMIVYKDGHTVGTTGGGVNEERTRKAALELFSKGGSEVLKYDMSNSDLYGGDPVCGGKSSVLIELQTAAPRLVVFGGGHIGCILAKIASLINFQVTIADERPEYADSKLFSAGIDVICDPYLEAVSKAKISADCFVVVATPGHAFDREVIEAVLPYKPQYLGLVGSRKKTVQFKTELKAKGFDEKQVDDLFTPIGISLGSNTPEEICIEIMAQIVAFRNGKIVRHLKEPDKTMGCPS